VNDPLVHYAAADLYDASQTDTNSIQVLLPNQAAPPDNMGQLNKRYQPWGGNPNSSVASLQTYDLAFKDPMITRSDDWNFPTNNFPTLGWLGRVHRGTPWQTFYLKSPVANDKEWFKWAGSTDTQPKSDWDLVGLFTTAINDNAARGLLSVNQTNDAAWAAVLSGVTVLSNAAPNAAPNVQSVPTYVPMYVQPTSAQSPQLSLIVSNINATRQKVSGGEFQNLGDVLASPALTVASPYLNTNQLQFGISDEVVEWIPQQILSLLKDDEPFLVIYSFGQSLKPAADSIVTAPGPYRGLCTNYEISGEAVTKTAVRIEQLRRQGNQPRQYRAVVESFEVLPTD
jgi:hypothetical protein